MEEKLIQMSNDERVAHLIIGDSFVVSSDEHAEARMKYILRAFNETAKQLGVSLRTHNT
jgi:hypothetical protein